MKTLSFRFVSPVNTISFRAATDMLLAARNVFGMIARKTNRIVVCFGFVV